MDISKIGGERVLDKNIQKTDKAGESGQKGNVDNNSAVKQSTSEKVKWSEDAGLLAEGVNAVKNSPDVRQEKVEALRNAIAKGTYKVDPDALASKMINSSLADDLLTRKG